MPQSFSESLIGIWADMKLGLGDAVTLNMGVWILVGDK